MRTIPLVAVAGLAGYAAAKSPPKVPERLVRGVRRPMDAVGFLVYATVVGGRLPEREVLRAVSKELISGSLEAARPVPHGGAPPHDDVGSTQDEAVPPASPMFAAARELVEV